MSGTALYEELLAELKNYAEPEYAAFHKRLLKNDKINVLGVRVPTLKKIAKRYKNAINPLLCCNDDYYEVTFIKLQAVALLPYEEFIKYVDRCVSLIDNWATCDSFAPKCIAGHKEEFMPYIYGFLGTDGNVKATEFTQRFALTTLLHFYVEEKYLETIFDTVQEDADLGLYYVHMAAAWLIAEVLVKYYDEGVAFLKCNAECYDKEGKGREFFDLKTHNKAIQKACESFRLTKEQKDFLKGLKR
ncbi:MAG: DNA alkylation repair protein [Roseburia sp.]|nr:DNA alkylation repair protein [Roseburia sp.]